MDSSRKRALKCALSLLGTVWIPLAALGAGAFHPHGHERPLPDFDKRSGQPPPDGKLRGARAAALDKLRQRLPDVRFEAHPVLGTPKYLVSSAGFLSGPNGAGRGLPARGAGGQLAEDPHRPIKDFVDEYPILFGHEARALDPAWINRDAVTAHNGLRTVVWKQRLEDLPIYEAVFIGNMSARGELVSLSSQWLAQPERAADAGTPNRALFGKVPPIPAVRAVAISGGQVEEAVEEGEIKLLPPRPGRAADEQPHRFKAGTIPGETRARLVWFPLSADRLRLCWEVELTRRDGGERYRLLVDALNGEVLVRQRLTVYVSEATFSVFTTDSPRGFSPGWPAPNTNQPGVLGRSLVTLSALRTNASWIGWINDGENETRGNNVDAHLDRNGDDVPDLPRPQGSPFRVFAPPLDLTASPVASGDAAVVQLFYWCNWLHDRLYDLGFTEATGNFQKDNFGRGGSGDDAMQADAQDGSGLNNANFTPTPDGEPGRIQMFLWSGPDPDVDGDLDAEIVIHEYVHGLSTRLVGGGGGITALQSAGLGEGWSDFYALALLSEPGDDLDASYAFGAYAAHELAGLRENYYFGIRRYPYSTDLTRNPLTLRDIDPLQIQAHTGVPTSPLFGFTPFLAGEVHAQGEVWCAMLWDARANLVRKHGFAGNELILRLVTDGMKLAPPNPSFTQARDAILLADLLNHQGANSAELWTAFARRGLGFSASTPEPGRTTGVREAFDLPDSLLIPETGRLVASGTPGGPFTAPCQSYSLTNTSSQPLPWSLQVAGSWLAASPTAGVLAPRTSTDVVVCLTPNAVTLPLGAYSGSLRFSNAVTGVVQTRGADLTVVTFTIMPVHENFEAGQLQPGWAISGTGQAAVTSLNGPREGGCHFALDSLEGRRSRNELTLGVDLAGYTNVVLRFWAKSFGDEPDGPPPAPFIGDADFDGVALSLDGVTWYEIQSLRAVPSVYQEFSIDLDAAMAQLGLQYNRTVRIRFNQIDDFQIPFDGITLDDISLEGVGLRRITVLLPDTGSEGAGLLTQPGRVKLGSSATNALTVRLTTTHPNKVSVPASLTIPAGADQAEFGVVLRDDSQLDGTVRVQVHAEADSFVSGQGEIQVTDNEPGLLRVSLPRRAKEGDGRLFRQGVVRVQGRPAGPIQVELRSSDPAYLAVPALVTVPAGDASAAFDLTVGDNDRLEAAHTVTVTAHVPGWRDGQDRISILDNDVPELSMMLPIALGEDSGVRTNAGSVRLSARVRTNLVVALGSSAPSQLRVPATVEVKANSREATFDLAPLNDSSIDGPQRVTITAQAPGFAKGSAQVDLEDDETPPSPVQPSPAAGATNVGVSVRLTWNPGVGNILLNGGFEAGDFTGWSQTNAGYGTWVVNDGQVNPDGPEDLAAPRTGKFSALLMQTGGGTHGLFQDVFVPVDALGASLRWSDRVRNFAYHFASNQMFRVEIRDTNDVALAIAYETRAGDPLLNEWTSRSFDLDPFRGRAVRVAFVEADSIGYLNVGLDDVSVLLEEPSVPTTFDVYLGTTPRPGPGEFLGRTTNAFWVLPPLALSTPYSWQVVARRGAASRSGPIWNFTTRGVGAFHHLAWSPIASPQWVDQPIGVTVSARDDIGNLISDFNGPVHVSAWPGSGTGSSVLVTELDIAGHDRVEFANVLTEPVDLSGWRITLYDSASWPGPLTTVTLPAGSLCAPGELFQLNDNGEAPGQYPSFNAGTNVQWSAADFGNPIAVLLQDAAGNVVDFACAGDASAAAITQPVILPREEWSGPAVVATLLLSHSLQRVGQVDHQDRSDWIVATNTFGQTNAGLFLPFMPRPTVAVNPSQITYFTGGLWTGHLKVSEPASRLRFRADDSAGYSGLSEEFAVGALNDLSVTIQDSPDVVLLGESVTYQVTVTNTGPSRATQVTLTNSLPAQVGFLSLAAPYGACSYMDGRVVCQFSPLSAGEGVQLTIRGRALRPGLVTNVAAVWRAESDGFPANNTAWAVSTLTGPSISTTNFIVTEGETSTNAAEVLVRLSAPCAFPVSVHYATSNGTALAGQDYVPVSGTLTFLPGQTNLSVVVPTVNDSLNERLEAFFLRLSDPTNGVIHFSQARVRILDDDPAPRLSISDVSVVEAPTGVTNELLFNVSLSAPSRLPVSVDFTTEDRTATAPQDYLTTFGTLTIDPGTTNRVVRIPMRGDDRFEPTERFVLTFSNPIAATLEQPTAIATATVTILDDDAGALHRFVWGPVPSPQWVDQPFQATLTALNGLNEPASDYQGTVVLQAVADSREMAAGSGTNTWEFPLSTGYHDARTQVIFPPETLGGPARLTALALDIVSTPGQTLSNWTLRLKHTALRTYTDPAWETDGWTVVYQHDEVPPEPGWTTFLFDQEFAYDGTNALLLDFSFNNASYSDPGLVRSSPTPAAQTLSFRTDGAFGDPLQWSGRNGPPPIPIARIPNVRFFAEASASVTPNGPIQLRYGRWSGPVTLHQTGSNFFLRASDRAGHIAIGNGFAVESSADSDADGLPDSWEQRHFGSNASTPGDDPDRDGLNNLEEFFAGTIPTDTGSVTRIDAVAVRGGDLVIRFLSIGGKSYRLERTASLSAPYWEPVIDDLVGEGRLQEIVDPGAADRPAFYRIRLEGPRP